MLAASFRSDACCEFQIRDRSSGQPRRTAMLSHFETSSCLIQSRRHADLSLNTPACEETEGNTQ